MLIFILAGIITPSRDNQLRGWRRARKEGASSLPWLADAATGFWSVLIMALASAAGWFLFTRALVESHCFPGHQVPWQTFGFFAAVLLVCGIGYHALLEAKGGRVVGLLAICVGVVPLMAGAVLGPISNRMIAPAAWLIGISPASTPFYAAATLFSLAELPPEIACAVPSAFYFWLAVGGFLALWLVFGLRAKRRAMARNVLAAPAAAPALASR